MIDPFVWPKPCAACKRVHTPETWKALRLKGVQEFGEGIEALELRDCSCGSTLGIPIGEARALHRRCLHCGSSLSYRPDGYRTAAAPDDYCSRCHRFAANRREEDEPTAEDFAIDDAVDREELERGPWRTGADVVKMPDGSTMRFKGRHR